MQVNSDVYISIKISLKFVPSGPINNISALVQIMAWRRPNRLQDYLHFVSITFTPCEWWCSHLIVSNVFGFQAPCGPELFLSNSSIGITYNGLMGIAYREWLTIVWRIMPHCINQWTAKLTTFTKYLNVCITVTSCDRQGILDHPATLRFV